MRYFRRRWDEAEVVYFFATDETGLVREQVEVYDDGRVLRYDEARPSDAHGSLSDQRLDLAELAAHEIDEATYRRRGTVTREQIERGTAALVPFVGAWNLPLNPEQLDELAYAVLTHGQKVGPIDPAEWDAIDRAVRAQLEDAARRYGPQPSGA